MAASDALRPADWSAFIGQEKMKRRLQISIDSAINRLEPLDHVLLIAEPGVGKTSLAQLIANELQCEFTPLVMPIKTKALQKILQEATGVLLLDEIHRLSKADQEDLLPVLEDNEIQLANGEKYKIEQPLTIVAATTEPQDIIRPLRDRFTHLPKFENYTDEDMAEIVKRMAARVDLFPSDEEALLLGKASAGVPRQARSIVFTARDLMSTDPELILETIGITPEGLTEHHVEYMIALETLGRQAGVELLCNMTGLPKDMLLDNEKLLLRKKYIEYMPRGRMMTLRGMELVKQLIAAQEEETV